VDDSDIVCKIAGVGWEKCRRLRPGMEDFYKRKYKEIKGSEAIAALTNT
jgi:hypothetical protein